MSKVWHYCRCPFTAEFRESSIILVVTVGRHFAEIRLQPQHAARRPNKSHFVGLPLASCSDLQHIAKHRITWRLKNSINYLEIRSNVFLFQRTPLHLSLSLSLSLPPSQFFQLHGHPWGVSGTKFIFFISRTLREVNIIFFARCNCQRKGFLYFACCAGYSEVWDSLASQASTLEGIQEELEELWLGGPLIKE